MKFRVHYATSKLRGPQSTVVNAETKGEAAASFSHHFPGTRLTRIEPIEEVRVPSKAPRSANPMGAEYRPMTDADRENCIRGLQNLREKLRTTPVPVARPGIVSISMEERDRGVSPSKP